MADEFLFESINVIDFTCESKATGDRSVLDHFLLSENFKSSIVKYDVLHEGDNLSDHSAIMLTLSIPMNYTAPSDVSHKSEKLNWDKASESVLSIINVCCLNCCVMFTFQ